MTERYDNPTPVFDTLPEVVELYKASQNADTPTQPIKSWLNSCFKERKRKPPSFAGKDYLLVLRFLYNYRGSKDTFGSYRREVERLLQWSWFVHEKSITKLKREDIESFIEFCIKPYRRWISLKKVARFKLIDGQKIPNPEWRPFEGRISKKSRKEGVEATKADYALSQSGLKALFAILGSFYNYLLQEEVVLANPVALIRQKSKYIRKEAKQAVIRRLSDKQWDAVLSVAKELAKKDVAHERGVFILSCLYGMYLRISELVSSERWSPTMSDFFKDPDGNWWFKTVGKGNKARQIAVSDSMLKALTHYRIIYLKTTPYPLPDDTSPLISHLNNHSKPISSGYPIRALVQKYFDMAASAFIDKGELQEADNLCSATVHWLRHTGISDDVKTRPREHVREDAGHSSGAITDLYIDIELKERAKSAKEKTIEK